MIFNNGWETLKSASISLLSREGTKWKIAKVAFLLADAEMHLKAWREKKNSGSTNELQHWRTCGTYENLKFTISGWPCFEHLCNISMRIKIFIFKMTQSLYRVCKIVQLRWVLRPNDYSKELTTQKKMTHFELMLNLMKWRKEIELRRKNNYSFHLD